MQRDPSFESTSASSNSGLLGINGRDNCEGSAVTGTTKRWHHKSRTGCKNCKTRRVKCDEKKPRCTSCIRRQLHCDLVGSGSSSSSYPENNNDTGSISAPLLMAEIELMYHYTTSTCHSIGVWFQGGLRLQNSMANIGFQPSHTLYASFALTALHLARFRTARRDEFVKKADFYYERALALVTPEIANIHPDNCKAILGTVNAMCFISWARGPQPGEYLAFAKEGRSDWLIMFRGIRSTTESVVKETFDRLHAPAARPAARPTDRPLLALKAPEDYQTQLDELREHVRHFSEDTPGSEGDMTAVEVLCEMYSNRYQGKDTEYHVVFGWLYRMTDEFLDRLQQRDPIPLTIYAHFVVLMYDMERFWYMQGWTHHVMSGIFEALEPTHQPWIRWPMAQVGWIGT